MSWFDDFNPAQREAVTCPDGPVLVLAGAGAGKTKTITGRVAWLIDQGVRPDRILLLTFTRRAADEMLRRTERQAGAKARKVWGGTFHSTANSLLRRHGRAIGLSPAFSVIDNADSADLMDLIRTDLGLAKPDKRFPRKDTLQAIYGRVVSSRLKLKQVLEDDFPAYQEYTEGIRQLFEAYATRKREQNMLDYDDLLLFWKALLDTPGVGDKVADLFDHVLVDEYQDTNLLQAEILQAMRRRKRNIMVVGDDAQSIYSFRSATVRNMLDFPKQFDGARIIKLEENYRSTQPILDAANAVMEQAKERFTKNLFTKRAGGAKPSIITCRDEFAQSNEVCERVLAKREEGVPLKHQAVLFRAGHDSDQLEVELASRNIPFVKYGGLKFVEAAHVKDLVAVLRILENPSDRLSWLRVLKLLPDIGPATATKIMMELGVTEADGPGNPLKALSEAPPKTPSGAAASFGALRAALLEIAGNADMSPAAQVERIRRFYEPVFERVYENPTVRLRDLDQLELIASNAKTRNKFITDLTLDPPSSTADLADQSQIDDDHLILSTIHSAKGLEWDAVHVIHAADGKIPSDMATGSEEDLDEERRLLYVAMTRAKDSLNIYFPLRYYHRGRSVSDDHAYAQMSRFLAEVDPGLFERVAAVGPDQDEGTLESVGAVDRSGVDAMLKGLWAD